MWVCGAWFRNRQWPLGPLGELICDTRQQGTEGKETLFPALQGGPMGNGTPRVERAFGAAPTGTHGKSPD